MAFDGYKMKFNRTAYPHSFSGSFSISTYLLLTLKVHVHMFSRSAKMNIDGITAFKLSQILARYACGV